MTNRSLSAVLALIFGAGVLILLTGCGSTAIGPAPPVPPVPLNLTTPIGPSFNIGGALNPATETAGATVTLSGAAKATTIADANGNYVFSGVGNGTYTVTPTKSGTGFNPLSQTVTIDGSSNTAVNFSAGVTSAGITLQSISITAAGNAIAKGTNDQFTAIGTFSDGTTQNLTNSATWTSSNPAIFSINPAGTGTGVSTGSSNIAASQSGVTSNTVALTVTASTLQSITINDATASISKGTSDQFTATGTFSDGSTQNLTASTIWLSSNSTAATVSAGGLVSGLAVGSTSVTATQNGITSNALTLAVTAATLQSITITSNSAPIAKGTTDQFTATGTFSDGTTQNLTSSATWISSNTTAVAINAIGIATGIAAGSSNMTATQNGVTSNAVALTVTPATLQSITITTTSTSIAKGTTDQFTATGTFSDGTTQDLTSSATWTSSNTAAVTINTSGVATGAAVGSSNITAAQNGITSNTIAFTVTAATLQSITITAATTSIAKGTADDFTATGTFSDGTTQNLTNSATWASSNSSVVTISASGVASGSGVGSTNIAATQSGITSNPIALTVTAATLQSITITAASTSISKGTTDQFTAAGTFTDGTTQNLTSSTNWTSSNTATAAISTSGVASGAALGSSNITATQGGVTSNTITLTVTAATLQSITITAPSTSIALGTADQFTATGTFTDGTTQNLTNSANWTSSSTAAATISAGGLASGAGLGSSNITATQGGVTSNTIVLAVTAATLQSITITPASTSIPKGTTDQFTATGTFTDGTTQNLTNSANWTSSNTAAATISASGLASGAGVGPSNITAAQNGVTSNTIALAVTVPSLVSLTVTPSSVSVLTGQSVQFTATGTYTDGTTQDLTNSVTWSVASGSAATMSSTAGGGGAAAARTRISANRQRQSRAVTLGQDRTIVQTRTRYRDIGSLHGKLRLDLAVGRMESFDAPLHIAQRLSDLCCFDRRGRSMRERAWQFGAVCLIALASLDLSCGGNAGTNVAVTVSNPNVALQTGVPQQFTATVTGSTNLAVNWSVNTVAGGNSTVGTISSAGLYTAPATVPSPATVTVTATSQADTTKSASATVTISTTPSPVAVTITPLSVIVQTGTTQQFTAGVTGTTNTAVTWSVNGVAGGNSTLGAISAAGLYTAPASVPSPATVSVTATSQADTTKSGSATLTVSGTPPPVAVSISPPSATVQISATQQFTATVTGTTNTTVTWSVNSVTGGNSTVGTISSTGLYTASATVPSPATVTVTASSQADTTKSGSVTVTISAGAAALGVVTSNLANGTVSVAYNSTLAASGGSTPYTWSVSVGSLPAGLSLSSGTGIISGTPTASGQTNFTVQVADAASHTASAPLSITVASANLQGTAGATATQYVLTYAATQSTTQGCQIEVSESPTYTPLVHAVDPALFLNSNFDGQTAIGPHTFVVGRRTYLQENAQPPSITVSAGQASRNGKTTPTPPTGNGNGIVTVNFAGQPFVVGDNITVVASAGDAAYATPWARVITASANSFQYTVLTNATDTTLGSLSITRANRYSLALQNNTTHYYRVSGCVATPITGTFNTMNWPNGDTWADVWPLDSNGNEILPTIPEDRSGAQHIIDPFTGTLVKPLTLSTDRTQVSYYATGSGGQHHCSYQADSSGYYHCLVDVGHVGGSDLYTIKTSTGEVHYQGQLFWPGQPQCGQVGFGPGVNAGFDQNDPNTLWTACNNASNTHVYVVKATFNGNPAVDVASGTSTPIVGGTPTTVTADPNSLDVLAHAFNSAYDVTKYNGTTPWGTEADSPILYVQEGRWQQGSPAFAIVYNTSNNTVVAVGNSWANGVSAGSCSGTSCGNMNFTRWCGSHGTPGKYALGGWTAEGLTGFVSGQNTMGYFEMTLNQGAGLNSLDTTDTITVTSNASAPGSPGDPASADIPPDGSNFLDQARPGDLFKFEDTGEIAMVTARSSATSLTVARGCPLPTSLSGLTCTGTAEAAHTNGVKMRAVCTPYDSEHGAKYWNFLNDPLATDNTNTNVIWDTGVFGGGHGGAKYPREIAEGAWNIRSSPTWDSTYFRSHIHDFAVVPNIAFNNTAVATGAATFQSYAHYYPADTTNVTWAWDTMVYAGAEYSGELGNQVAGTTFIYKYVFNSQHVFNPNVPYFYVSGRTQLLDISGVNSLLSDTSADNDKFCIVKIAGECWSGSQPGEVYANLPGFGAATGTCSGSETGVGGGDWCVENMPPLAHGMNQIGMTPADQIGTNPNDGTLVYGMGKSRKLVIGAYEPPRLIISHPQSLPDNSWVYWDECLQDPYIQSEGPQTNCEAEIYMAKIPPQPAVDNVNRTTYQDIPGVQVGALGTGATHARVKYGYEEYGPRTSFFCTQRKETCYFSNQSLALNQTVTLSGIGVTQHVLFYEIEYLDASNNVAATGSVQAIAIP